MRINGWYALKDMLCHPDSNLKVLHTTRCNNLDNCIAGSSVKQLFMKSNRNINEVGYGRQSYAKLEEILLYGNEINDAATQRLYPMP